MRNRNKLVWRLGASLLLAWSAAAPARADYPSTVLSQNPAAYYRLNETVIPSAAPYATNSGSLGAGADGTYEASPTFNLPGPFAASVSLGLDGASYVDTPLTPGLETTSFTFEIWAQPSSPADYTYLADTFEYYSPRTGWYLVQDGTDNFGYGPSWVVRLFYANGTTPAVTLHTPIVGGAGTWVHLALTYDNSTKIATLYANGVAANSAVAAGYAPNLGTEDFTVGVRNIDAGYGWAGNVAQSAIYGTALSSSRIAAHYTAATTAPGTYVSTVLADSPVLYQTYQAPPQAPANNSGTLGTADNGLYIPDAVPGVAGPVPATYGGFDSGNTAVQFDAGGGGVKLPPFNFNTNTVTISGWVKASDVPASKGAGIILSSSGGSQSGLILDNVNAGLGLGYSWAGDASTFNKSLSGDYGLPALNQNEWDYVALVVQPTQADIYIASPTIPFQNVTVLNTHIVQSFNGSSFIGQDGGTPAVNFLGGIDEVAFWNRSLSAGELYTQFGAAVGGLAPRIFADLQPLSGPVYAGDPLTLSADIGGTPDLVYQWYLNDSPIAAPLGTNSTYTKASFNLATDQGNYKVVVTNPYGSVISAVVTVSGLPDTAPDILAGPVGQTIYPGGSLNLSVVANGGGLTYQWKTNGVAIGGANQPEYKIAGVTAANAASYTVTVANLLGATNVGPAVITVPTLTPGTFVYLIAYSNSPTAWWRLDETNVSTGAILYDAEGLHNGTYTNNGGLTAGVAGAITGNAAGTALRFNGDGSYGYIPYFAGLSGAKFTIELWAKQTVATANVTAASSWDSSSSSAGFDIGTGTAWWGANNADYEIGQSAPLNSYDPTIYPGQWVHIVLEHGGTANSSYPWQIYINGYNDGTYIYGDDSPLNSSKPFIIGGRGTGLASILNHYYVGSLDEIAFYNKNLSVGQIQADYAAATAGLPPTFVAQPQPLNAFVGENATFNVRVAGGAPIALQWLKNGARVTGATSSALTVSNVFYTASADAYSVIATNVNGSATSAVASVTVYYPPKFANLTNALVLHLAFDGNYNDTSGRGNYGIPNQGPTVTNLGKIGSDSLVYQTYTVTNLTASLSNVIVTSSNWVDLGTGYGGNNDLRFGATTSFSVSLWVKLTNGYTGGDLPFIGNAAGSLNNSGWVLAPTYGTGGWQFGLNDGVQTQATTNNIDVTGSDNSINDGNWHNLVLVVNRAGNKATAYLDGVNEGSEDITGFGSLDSGNPVTIGQDPTHGYPVFPTGASANSLNVWKNGWQSANLDDLGIWRRALTDLEARSIYFAGKNNTNSFNTVGPVVLSLGALSGNVRDITWQAGTLVQSTNLVGPWTPVPGAVAPFYQFTPQATGNLFYGVAP